MKTAVFIDRDAILNVVRLGSGEPGSALGVEEAMPILAAEPALRRLKRGGSVLIVTTNQPGLSRGSQSRRDLDRTHELLRRTFPVDDTLVCPHEAADHCPCRRPLPGLLIEAAFKWHLNLDRSFVVSEKWQDAEAARAAGCTSLLLRSPFNADSHHDLVLDRLDQVVAKILSLQQRQLACA